MNQCRLIILLALVIVLFAGCNRGSAVFTSPNTSPTIQASSLEPQQLTNIQILTPTGADNIDFAAYSEGIFCIYNGSYGEYARKYGFMRTDGTQITQYIYDYAYPFSEGLACVRIDGKWGFIDTDGNTVLPVVYDNATPFSEGLAYFERDASYGFMDCSGNVAFLLDCDSISSFQEGLAFFSVDGKYGYIDTSGNVISAPMFDDAGFFVDGIAKVRVGFTYGFIDKTGAFTISPIYEDVTVDGGYVCIKSAGLYGILRDNGDVILPLEYSRIKLLSDYNAAIVDTETGTKIIGFDGTTSETYAFWGYEDGDGLLQVSTAGKFGFLNATDFSVAIPLIYDNVSQFISEYAAVSLDGRYGVINKNGDVVIPFDYDWIKVFANETFAVSSAGKYGLLDRNGNFMCSIEYEYIQQSGDGYAVEIDNKYGFLDASGNEIIPPTYNHCFDWVYGAGNCFVINKGYGHGSHSIAVLGEIRETDLSELLLRNEITPRIRPYRQFIKEGAFEIESFEEGSPFDQVSTNALNDFAHFYKLYKVGESGAPIMYYYARPIQESGFPLSYSGFYSVKDGKLSTLTTGYECGGSMGGDYICFWRDNKTLEIYVGTYYHYGGFGGYAHGGNVYKYTDDNAVPIISFGYINQSSRNYEQSELVKNAHLFYDSDGIPYTNDTILKALEDYQAVTEYLVNEEQTTVAKYREVADRYSLLILWWWGGY